MSAKIESILEEIDYIKGVINEFVSSGKDEAYVTQYRLRLNSLMEQLHAANGSLNESKNLLKD